MNMTKAGTYFEMSSLSKIGALALCVLAAFSYYNSTYSDQLDNLLLFFGYWFLK